MKKLLIVCCSLLFLLQANTLVAAEKETFIINMTSYYPDWHPVVRDVLRPWAKEVLVKSQGRLVIRLFEPNTICQDEQASQAVRLGQIGVGHGYAGAEPARFPLSMASSLYLGLNLPNELTSAFWRMYTELPEISGEFAGIKVLALHSASPYQICMIKQPVYGADDLRGKNILVDSPTAAHKISLLGANPVQSPITDFLPRLDENDLDGALLTLTQANIAGLRDRVRQVALADIPSGICWLGMHQGLWDILPQDLRKILTDTTGQKLSQALSESLYQTNRNEIESLWQFRIDLHYLSAEEREKIRQTLQKPLAEMWQEDARGAGVAAPRTLYEKISKIAAEIAASRL